MIGAGYITAQEFEEDLARLDDPDFLMPSSIMWTAWGQRPKSQVVPNNTEGTGGEADDLLA